MEYLKKMSHGPQTLLLEMILDEGSNEHLVINKTSLLGVIKIIPIDNYDDKKDDITNTTIAINQSDSDYKKILSRKSRTFHYDKKFAYEYVPYSKASYEWRIKQDTISDKNGDLITNTTGSGFPYFDDRNLSVTNLIDFCCDMSYFDILNIILTEFETYVKKFFNYRQQLPNDQIITDHALFYKIFSNPEDANKYSHVPKNPIHLLYLNLEDFIEYELINSRNSIALAIKNLILIVEYIGTISIEDSLRHKIIRSIGEIDPELYYRIMYKNTKSNIGEHLIDILTWEIYEE